MRKLVWWGAASLAVIAVAVGVLGADLGWDWGDVPTWVQSVATVAALGAAGVGAYFAYGQLRMLRDQVRLQDKALTLQIEQLTADRRESEQRAEQELRLLKVAARKQAEQVDVMPTKRTVELDGTTHEGMLAVRIGNSSPRPIRNVSCRLDMKPYSLMPYGRHVATKSESWNSPIERSPIAPLPLLRSRESVALVFPVVKIGEDTLNAPTDPTHILWAREPDNRISDNVFPGQGIISPVIAYVVRFTDDADQHWELTDEMRLTSIPDRNDW